MLSLLLVEGMTALAAGIAIACGSAVGAIAMGTMRWFQEAW